MHPHPADTPSLSPFPAAPCLPITHGVGLGHTPCVHPSIIPLWVLEQWRGLLPTSAGLWGPQVPGPGSQPLCLQVDQPTLGMPSRQYYFNEGNQKVSPGGPLSCSGPLQPLSLRAHWGPAPCHPPPTPTESCSGAQLRPGPSAQVREAYLQFMVSVAEMLRADLNLSLNSRLVWEDMAQVLKLETQLANVRRGLRAGGRGCEVGLAGLWAVGRGLRAAGGACGLRACGMWGGACGLWGGGWGRGAGPGPWPPPLVTA